MQQLSRDKFDRFPRATTGFTLCVLDRYGLRDHWPARPTLTPQIRFLYIGSRPPAFLSFTPFASFFSSSCTPDRPFLRSCRPSFAARDFPPPLQVAAVRATIAPSACFP